MSVPLPPLNLSSNAIGAPVRLGESGIGFGDYTGVTAATSGATGSASGTKGDPLATGSWAKAAGFAIAGAGLFALWKRGRR